MTDWNRIPDVQQAITDWANKNFPRRTAHSALVKLVMEEVPELVRDLKSPGEYADCLILLFDIASLMGIDIARAVHDKMIINQNREWEFDEKTGLAHHVQHTFAFEEIETEGGTHD